MPSRALSPDKRLSSFDFAAVPSVSKAQVMALAEGHEWLERGANVLLFGPPGVGKSHLIAGLGHALIDAGRRVLFTRCSELVQRLQAARRDLRLPQELAKLDRFDLLILDDLSYVRRDQAETSVLFELISERYERKSIAITANTPFSQWGEVFVDAGHDGGRRGSAGAPRHDSGDERRELPPPGRAGSTTPGAPGKSGDNYRGRRLKHTRPPWTSHLPTGRACGQPLRGTCLAHRSPNWSLRPDALRLPNSR